MPELIIESAVHGTHTVLYDEEDREIIEGYKWQIRKKSQTYYVCAKVYGPDKDEWYISPTSGKRQRKRKTIRMHRLITKCPKGLQVDHINHNGLDNRRKNLRICNNVQNQWNRRKGNNNNSGFKGVSIESRRKTKKYRVQIGYMGKTRHLGYFESPVEAAKIYDAKAKELFGEFANLNFPDE